MRFRIQSSAVVCAGVGLSLLVPLAQASFSLVSSPAAGEASMAQILQGVYSPSTVWTALGTRPDTNGAPVDFTNGALSALRVDDAGLGGILNVNTGHVGVTDDATWTGGPLHATARARYAGYEQQFGIDYGNDSTGYVALFDISGVGLNVSGSDTIDVSGGTTWSFARSGHNLTWYSDVTRNSDQRDHMLTYQITGATDGLQHWMLFWEDMPSLGDSDFNDLAVEITATTPEPASALGGVVCVAAVALLRRR